MHVLCGCLYCAVRGLEGEEDIVRDLATTDPLIEDLAMLIDEAREHPSRAAAVKARIKARLGRSDAQATPERPGDAAEADVEDFWDNVPL